MSSVERVGKEILRVDDLHVHFPVRGDSFFRRSGAKVKAVDAVSFALDRGETLGLGG